MKKDLTFKYEFNVSHDSGLVGRHMSNDNREHCFQLELSARSCDSELPDPILDLLDLVQAVFAVDRLSQRHPDPDGYGWGRRFQVKLPVRAVDFWRQRE